MTRLLCAFLALLPIFTAALPQDIGITIPLSKRSTLKKPDGSVNIDYLRKHLSHVEGKLKQGLAAYQKNTGNSLAVEAPATSRKRAQASDPLTDDNAELWHGTISVGTPPVKYTVDFDTGSSDLFLPDASCRTNCDGHTKYNPSKSSTSKSLGKSFSLAYGDGSTVSGKQYTDTVSIAGLSATKHTLGSATRYSTGFSSDRFPPDGLLGMGFQTISQYNAPPLFQSLVRQNKVSQPVFAFKLATQGSELTLGGLNKDLYKGDFTYVPVTQQAYWQVELDSLSIGDAEVLKSVSSIIDTGTTLIVGDSSSVSGVYQSIPGAKDASDTLGDGIWTIPCDGIPNVSLTFGGKPFQVAPATFSLGPAQPGSSDCVGGIASANVGGIGWIIGDVFLQNVYTAFDLGKNQVGFAQLA